MVKVCRKTSQFWKEMQTNKEGVKIYELAKSICSNIKKVKDNNEKLISKTNFRNINFLIVYAEFFESIVKDKVESEKAKETLLSKINRSDFSRVKSLTDSVFSFLDIDDVGVVTISGDLKELGKIIFTNFKMSAIFKFPSDSLVENSINKIIPYYIGKEHDLYIERYFNTAKKHVLDRIRIVFGINGQDFIFPVYITVKVVPSLERSIRFVGLLKKIEKNSSFFKSVSSKDSTRTCFLMADHNGNIVGVSKDAFAILGIPPSIVLNASNLSITQVNLREIFDVDFMDNQIRNAGLSEKGIITKICTKKLKPKFFDYVDTQLTSNKDFLDEMGIIEVTDDIFGSKDVVVNLSELSFNDDTLQAKILKIKLIGRENQFRSRKTIRTKNTIIQYFEEKKVELNPAVEEQEAEEELIRSEIANLRENINSSSFPSSVKRFIFVAFMFLSVLAGIGVTVFILASRQADSTRGAISVWLRNSQRYLYLTNLISSKHLQLLSSATEKKLDLVEVTAFLYENSVSNSNKILENIYSGKDLLPTLYFQSEIEVNNLERDRTERKETSDYSTLNDIIIEKAHSTAIEYEMQFMPFTTVSKVEKDIFYILENFGGEFFKHSFTFEKEILEGLKGVLHSDLADYLTFGAFGVFGVTLICFFFMLNGINRYKFKILKIFYLVEPVEGNDLIDKCEYFENNLEQLYQRKRSIKEADLGGNHIVEVSSGTEEIMESGKPLSKRSESNSEKTMELSISKSKSRFRRQILILHLKIIGISLILAGYFVSGDLMADYFSKKIGDSGSYLETISRRGAISSLTVQNFIATLFYKDIEVGPPEETDIAEIYSYKPSGKLSYLLEHVSTLENEVLLLSDEPIQGAFIEVRDQLESEQLCTYLEGVSPPGYIQTFKDYCNTEFQGRSLKDNIILITNEIQTRLEEIRMEGSVSTSTVRAALQPVLMARMRTFLAVATQSNSLLLEAAQASVNDYISFYSTFNWARIYCFVAVVLLFGAIFFYNGTILTKEINKDKSLITILPFNAISCNTEVQKAIMELREIE